MAPLMPQTTPWSRAPRGSNDGVKARQTKASAVHAPGRVYRNRRRSAAGVAAGSGSAPASSTLAVRVGVSSRWVVIDTSQHGS
jgi:hypothetical protein